MELPHIGSHCAYQECHRLDFLPVKCDGCEQLFCSRHITYVSHNCPSPKVVDNQVPVCPLCGEPVPSKRGDPPDIAVGNHIDRDCSSDPAVNSRKIYPYRCTLKKCKKKEMLPFTCNDCSMNFCIQHRHPTDHSCAGTPSQKTKASSKPAPPPSNGTVDFSKFQGTMSEDEAFAQALSRSMQGSERQHRPQNNQRSHDNCSIS